MKDDFIEIEDIVEELEKAQENNYYGDITIRLRGGKIIPIIDLKKTKKLKPKNGRN